MKSKKLLEGLTPAQKEAVQHIDGPLLVLAGPGSGKTRVITHRVAFMIEQGIKPEGILAITFTNKAAGEMKERLERLIGKAGCFISTFHSMCARFLRRYADRVGYDRSFSIYDTDDSLQVIKDVLKALELDSTYFRPPAVRSTISEFKNSMITPQMALAQAGNFRQQRLAEIYRRYQEELRTRHSMDFDDLLLYMLEALQQEDVLEEMHQRFSHILVDEYQDTNKVQYLLIKALAGKLANLCVTGDPDQSIYGWRGANIYNILDFEKDFPNCKVVRLERNYRSTKRILKAAEKLIQNNTLRKEKGIYTENPEGEPVEIYEVFTEKEESRFIAEKIRHWIEEGIEPSEIGVFYRVNSLSRNLEEYFRFHGIAYVVVGGVAFYQRMEIKDVLAYARLLVNPYDTASFCRVINTPKRSIGKATVEVLKEVAYQEGLDYVELVYQVEELSQLKPRAKKAVIRFRETLDRIMECEFSPVGDFFEHLVEAVEYRRHLEKNYTGEELHNRLSNLEELFVAAREYDQNFSDGLEGFLERVALISDVDEWENQQKVTLMTLHAAKGLEFKAVAIAGLEEGILPHSLCKDSVEQLEEERRLFYVGITRAKEHLLITYTRQRAMWGKTSYQIPSSFLDELDLPIQKAVPAERILWRR